MITSARLELLIPVPGIIDVGGEFFKDSSPFPNYTGTGINPLLAPIISPVIGLTIDADAAGILTVSCRTSKDGEIFHHGERTVEIVGTIPLPVSVDLSDVLNPLLQEPENGVTEIAISDGDQTCYILV